MKLKLDHQENLSIMKNKEKKIKAFDAVKFMREQRDILSNKISNLSKEEIIQHFESRKLQLNIKPIT